eukprot:jgi/Psemu1/59917/gm1.59917_g
MQRCWPATTQASAWTPRYSTLAKRGAPDRGERRTTQNTKPPHKHVFPNTASPVTLLHGSTSHSPTGTPVATHFSRHQMDPPSHKAHPVTFSHRDIPSNPSIHGQTAATRSTSIHYLYPVAWPPKTSPSLPVPVLAFLTPLCVPTAAHSSHTFAHLTPFQARFALLCATSPSQPQQVPSPHLNFHHLRPHFPVGPTNCHTHNPKRSTTKHNTQSRNMPITNLVLICLQSKCISSGYLTYSSLPLPDTKAIDTARNTYLKTLGFPSNALIHLFTLTPTAPSRPPISLAKALVSYPSTPFAAFAITIAPKNTVPLFCTWTDSTLLRDDFTSTANPASQVGMPQFLLVPLQ